MPIIDEIERPIQHVVISGPGVDTLEHRKEDNNNSPVSAETLLQNFESVRNTLVRALKSLVSQ